MDLNELRDRAYKTACAHGWHDEEYSNEHYLMLVITELAEAVNADRKSKYAFRKMFEENAHTPQPHPERHWAFCYEQFIKDSFEDELADTVIRCLDFAGLHGYDLQNVPNYIQVPNELKVFWDKLTFADIAFGICKMFILSADSREPIRCMLINVLKYCRYKGIDIEWHIEQKMKYNELRSFRHGNKKY